MSTTTAERCGHRWTRTLCPASGYSRHRCDQPANHPATVSHRCRCGTTTNPKGQTMTTYVSAENLVRHVTSGHDVTLVEAHGEPPDTVALRCDIPGCEWNEDHLLTVPGSDAPTVGGCQGCAEIRQRWHRRAAAQGLDESSPPQVVQDARCRSCGAAPLATSPEGASR